MISLFLIALFTGLMLAGLPVAASLLLASIVAMLAGGHDLMGIPQHMAASVRSLELMAIPFFILAAQLMTELGMTRRIFAFAEAAVGWMRGGLAHANVVAGFIFSGISGAAVADAAALGAISMREMPRAGYAPPFAAAVVMSVSTLGPIIPPSIMMVVYAIAANVSIARMFIAGLVPGLVIAIHARLGLTPIPDRTRFDWRRLAAATRSAALALFAPVVILRGMSTGMVTPTEAGVLACFYAMLVGALTGTLRWRALFNAFRDTAVSSAHILFIIAASSALSYIVIA
jgi:tripartite ATP-independent transporter DctM subunit